jgi:hypothetical protein
MFGSSDWHRRAIGSVVGSALVNRYQIVAALDLLFTRI